MYRLDLVTRRRCELIDITRAVRDQIRESGVRDGVAVLVAAHTTAAITINENADPDVVTDLLRRLEILAPPDPRDRHAEGNSDAHLKSSLLGASQTLIVADGVPVLGTWQGIYFCEFDGPRPRTVHIQVVGR